MIERLSLRSVSATRLPQFLFPMRADVTRGLFAGRQRLSTTGFSERLFSSRFLCPGLDIRSCILPDLREPFKLPMDIFLPNAKVIMLCRGEFPDEIDNKDAERSGMARQKDGPSRQSDEDRINDSLAEQRRLDEANRRRRERQGSSNW